MWKRKSEEINLEHSNTAMCFVRYETDSVQPCFRSGQQNRISCIRNSRSQVVNKKITRNKKKDAVQGL